MSRRVQQSGGELERVLAEAGAAVDELASGVEVAEVPGGLLDHVEHDEAQVRYLLVTSTVAPGGGVDSGVEATSARARAIWPR